MGEDTKKMKVPVIKRSPTIQEQEAIDGFKQKDLKKTNPIFRHCEVGGKETLKLAFDESLGNQEATDLLDSHIMAATGTADRILGIEMLSNIIRVILPEKANAEEMAEKFNTLAKSMQALAPQDEYEGQLVAQLVILHDHALDWLGRANRTERIDFANVYLNGASKLLMRHHETLESLLKYRRKG